MALGPTVKQAQVLLDSLTALGVTHPDVRRAVMQSYDFTCTAPILNELMKVRDPMLSLQENARKLDEEMTAFRTKLANRRKK